MDATLGDENTLRLKALAKQESPSQSKIEQDISASDPSLEHDAILQLIAKSPSTISDTTIQSLRNILISSTQDHTNHHTLAEASLAALTSLSSTNPLDNGTLLTATAYTNPIDTWATKAASSFASTLLNTHLPSDKLHDFIVSTVLQDHLRPIFSKGAGTSSVTAAGRPAAFREPAQAAGRRPAQAAWKEAGAQVVTIFEWAVHSADEMTLAKNWPLFIPVLVTLCEDDETTFRQRGLEILNTFLQKCPMQVIRTSGVDAVFQEAVFPTLLFLPSLTPEEKSVRLLRAAYKALMSLALVDSDVDAKKRVQLLDKVLREGVFTGYFHASQHIHVVQVIMESAGEVVNGLQIAAVKHLQKLLNLFSSVMTDSFALAYPPAVFAAAKALNTTILNCWPRIEGTQHAEQIIRIISIAWTNIQDHPSSEKSTELDRLSGELSKTSTLLSALWRENGPPQKLLDILKKEPELRPLFGQVV